MSLEANLTANRDNAQITVAGDFIISSGTLSCTNNSNRELTVYVGGDFTMSGGAITENGNYGEIISDGTGEQVFTKSGGTISNDIRFTVNSGAVLDMGTGVLDGSAGNFTMNDGAGLITDHPQGITASGNSGSIQVNRTRTFSSSADYTYSGTAAQVTGTGLPSSVRNLTVNNGAGVSLTSSVNDWRYTNAGFGSAWRWQQHADT